MLKDFKQFIIRGNMVDLAIAVVIGGAFNLVVQALVKDLITPLIALIGGQPDFGKYQFMIHKTMFNYGDFLNILISFIITASVVFFFVVQPMNRFFNLVKKDEPIIPTTRPCPFCKSDIPLDATRCKFCTSKVEAELTSKTLAKKIADA